MKSVNLADAKAHLSEPVAQLTAIATHRRPVARSALRALTDAMPRQAETAGDFIRRLRDDSRY